jgi:hypothetical protein
LPHSPSLQFYAAFLSHIGVNLVFWVHIDIGEFPGMKNAMIDGVHLGAGPRPNASAVIPRRTPATAKMWAARATNHAQVLRANIGTGLVNSA